MELERKICEVIEDPLLYIGYELVSVRIKGSGSKKYNFILEIDIDRVDEQPVSIDDCVKASQTISVLLDVENIIDSAYNLEVSSPGEWRALRTKRDFDRFCGKECRLDLFSAINNNRKLLGILIKIEGEVFEESVVYLNDACDNTGEIIEVPYHNIKKASVKRSF